MSGPWEKYQAAQPDAAAGPWAKYQTAPAGPEADAPPVDDIPRMLPRQRATALAGMPQGAMQPGDILAGAVRGAASIGATLSTMPGAGYFDRRADKLKAVDAQLQDWGADPQSFAYQAGKLGGEVAGTAGVGPVLAPVARAVGASPALVSAINTAGMRTGAAPVGLAAKAGDLATRSAGAAINGGASAAMVDPGSAAGGAVVGAVVPPAMKAVGAAGAAVGKTLKISGAELTNMFKSEPTRAAQDLIRALDLTPEQIPAVVAKLRGAETLVPGAAPTVAQALSKPQASILERVVSAGPGGERLREALAAQAEARMSALSGVAPVAPGGANQMRADTGEAIARYAQAERGAAAEANSAQYTGIDPARKAGVVLPAPEMRAAAHKYLGAGAVGENTAPTQFANEAEALGKPRGPAGPSLFGLGLPDTTRPASWDEVMRMRSSLNEQWLKAKTAGDRQAAAALDAQKRAIDDAIAQQLPPDMLARWQEANASRAAIGQRFDTGPQAAIFSTRNGEPLVQGGEVAAKFWGNRPGLAEDVQSFRRLIDDNPALLGQFRSMVTTEGAEKVADGGALGKRFTDWVRNMKPGLRAAFEPDQLAALERIAADVDRAGAAAKLGMGPGSNTYQNAANALDAGLLGSPFAKSVAQKLPFVGTVANGIRANLAESASKAKAQRLAGLLSDAGMAADELQRQVPSAAAAQFRHIMDMGGATMQTPIPQLGGLTLADFLRLGAYKTAPIGAAQ